MELKPPLTVRILFPACALGLMTLIIVPLLIRVAGALLRGQPSAELMILPFTVVMLWLGWAWAQPGDRWRLIADDEGITLKHGSRTTRIAWQQIDTCREEGSALERDDASWVTLRDSEDNILLRWQRSWFGHSKRSLAEFDRFTTFVQAKIAGSREPQEQPEEGLEGSA